MAPEGVYKESRTYQVRDRSPSDDEFDDRHYGSKTTVHRYKVNPSRLERVERIERIEDIDDDRRSRFSGYAGRSERDLLDIDAPRGRAYVPERPRSAFEPSPRGTLVEHKHVTKRDYDGDGVADDIEVYKESREYDRERGDRTSRQVVERIEREPGDPLGPEVRSRVEKRVVERGDDVPLSPRERDWDRQSRAGWDREETEVRVEKRVERRDDGEMRVERRVEERREEPFGDVERYRKETEYYEPAPPMAPIVIRQRAPEQKIIVQEAPSPAPLVIREERRYRDEDEYYRRREVGLYRGRDREEEYAMERYDRRRDRDRDRRGYSDDDEEYYVKKKTIVRERSQSVDHHRKRHLAEGALAGAGAAALLATRRSGDGGLQDNRGRKVIAGAALGALGTEVFKRAKSAYNDHYGEDGRGRSRSRSRSRYRDEDRHSKLKTGLGLAAAALAVAGAAKYYQTSKVEKEEASRGRSLRRGYTEEYYSSHSRSRTRSRSRSRAASVAKAAAGTAAVAGIVKHLRDKSRARSGGRSRSHSRSKSPRRRSRSRLRTGAEIVAAGLAGGAAKKIYDKHQEKKERERSRSVAAGNRRSRSRSRSRSLSSDWSHDRNRRRRSRSHSRSNARARLPPLPHNDSSRADSELGMVEYGNNPVAPEARRRGAGGGGGGGGGYDSATEDYEGRRRHRGRRSSYSESDQDEKKPEKKRSKSRLREMAAAGAGAAAAAIGLKGMQKRRERSREREEEEEERRREEENRERNRDRDRDRDRHRNRARSRVGFDERDVSPERDRNREREERARDRERRRYEDEMDDGYDSYDDRFHGHSHPPSPPHASGGAYIRPAMSGAAGPGFTSHPNIATTNINEYGGYHPADYGGYPPNSAPTPTGMPPPPAGMPPPAPPYPMDPRLPNNAPGPPPMGFPPGPPPQGMNPRGDHVSQVPLSKDTERPDGVKPRDRSLSRSTTSSFFSDTTVAAPSRTTLSPGHEHSKSVVFVPLSPKSSQTLRKLHEGQEDEKSAEHSDLGDEHTADQQQLVRHPAYPRRQEDQDSDYVDVGSTSRRHRSDSDGTMVHRPRHRQQRYSDTEDEDLVEVLPDRFDSQGRPIYDDGTRPPRWSSRRGEFEYRSPRRRGLEMQGQWAVGGSDSETVERAARQITSMLDGRGGWLGVLGGILGATLGRGDGRQGLIGNATGGGDVEGRRDRRRERDRRSRQDDDDDDDESDVGTAAVEYGAGDWRDDHHGRRRRRRGYD